MQKWQVGWGPIENCNLNCEFCYSKNARQYEKIVGYNDWINFVDQNHEHIDSINYGTGENTLSLDWFKLINYIRKKYPEITQALTTNGYLVDQISKDKKLYKITRNAIDEIDISLDFADEEKYCKFRGNDKVYQWALGTLKFCQDNKITSTIVFIGSKQILEENNIDGIFAIAKTYDAKVRMNIYRPTNTDAEVNNKFIVPFEKIINSLYFINKKYKILSISDPLFSSILTKSNHEADPSGSSSIRILHNGNITPSTYLITENFQLANITEKEVLKRLASEKVFSDFDIIPKKCNDCQFRDTCKGGVYDRRYLWYKSFEKRDPYCPFLEGNFLPSEHVKIYDDISFDSVHHGYLPSLFFTY